MANSHGVFPEEAPDFVRRVDGQSLSGAQRSALIRKGNELFNAEKYELAKRIFLTTRYSDGLIRLGHYHMERDEVIEAFRMYWLAPDHKRVAAMTEQFAGVIQQLLGDGQATPTDAGPE